MTPDGLVIPRPWQSPESLLQSVQALFLSREDILGQEAEVIEWFQRMPVGVLTADRVGALLFVNGERYEVQPRPAREVDPTGAGDVFAATFLIQYQRDGDAWQAAAAAACAGSLAVEGEGWSAVADRAALDAALARISNEPVGDVLDTRRRRSLPWLDGPRDPDHRRRRLGRGTARTIRGRRARSGRRCPSRRRARRGATRSTSTSA